MAFVKLLESHDVGEVAFVRSLLDANGIVYFVQNEHFGSLYPGIPLPPNNGIVMMVEEADLERAGTLVREMRRKPGLRAV